MLLAASIGAQTQPNPLLAEAIHVNGSVVDEDGLPVAGVRIDHSDYALTKLKTDPQGKFAFDTKAPNLVIRKAGFRSVLLQTKNAKNVRITLHSVPTASFPICSDKAKFDSLTGWESTFSFPKITGVKLGDETHSIDAGERTYSVRTKYGPKGIMHGGGPSWSDGLPNELDVWQSIQFEETIFNGGILDARGQSGNGNRWRYLGRMGESASYWNVDEVTAEILDQVLDGACVKSTSLQ